MKYVRRALVLVLFSLLVYSELHDHPFLTKMLRLPDYTANSIVNFLLFLFGGNITIWIISYFYRKRKGLGPDQMDNVLVGLNNIFYLLLAGAGVLVIFGIFGLDYKTLFTSLSIVAAAIAIISKDFLQEIISGFFISFSTEIRIDDYVKIGDQKGKITDITITKVALLNEDDNIIYIPNSKVFSNDIINYTQKQIKKVSIDFELNLSYLRTVESLENDLVQSLEDYHEHIENETFNLRIVEIHKDSLQMKFQYVLHEVNRELELQIRKATVRRVVNFINHQKETAEAGLMD